MMENGNKLSSRLARPVREGHEMTERSRINRLFKPSNNPTTLKRSLLNQSNDTFYANILLLDYL
jgi:hypothetical protein